MAEHRRPSWDDYFLQMAKLAATRATCPRRRVGAVLVRDQRVLATGYNGSIRGGQHCDDVGCLLVEQNGRPSCVRTVHAELNAILQCAINGISSANSTLYCTDFPCSGCAKALVQAGVKQVVFLSEYPDANSGIILRDGGVSLFKAIESDDGAYRLVHVDIQNAKTT
jgi:dCMP deaminase